MPQNFLRCDHDQELLLPPNMRDWLPDGRLASFMSDTVDALDLDAFYRACRADGHGRAAHDPEMMGWIQLVVATPDVEELRCAEEALL
jgi:hypothetical protein